MSDLKEIPITIRRMEVRDIARVREIDQNSFTLTWTENSYLFELTKNENSRLWVAEIHNPSGINEVVGVLGIWMIVDEAHIATLAVDPIYRKRHIANQLLEHALKETGKEGAATARLEVRVGNLAARTLYEKFGFYTVHIRPKYYADNGEDAALMDLDMIRAGYTVMGSISP